LNSISAIEIKQMKNKSERTLMRKTERNKAKEKNE
jgi:hypothetical protein